MSVYKDGERGSWYVQCSFKDHAGKRQCTTKRGFRTKHDAQVWERDFIASKQDTPSMTLDVFYRV